MPSPSRAAFLVRPHAGGTFTVFLNLRKALQPHGIALEWVGAEHNSEQLTANTLYAAHRDSGSAIDCGGMDEDAIGEALIAHLTAQRYDMVFINVLTSPAEMSVVAYLPESVRRVLIVHNITPGTYVAARACRPFAHAAVCVSPRIREDLMASQGFAADATFTVPNAMELTPAPLHGPASPRRLLSLGRIVDDDKGVFWLPEILAQLPDDYRLTIAGEGPDRPRLQALCRPLGSRVEFLGRVDAAAVPALAAAHGILLLTSRFEGFGYTLIEAMAQGCVPVSAAIRGVTDYVVQHERTGLLVPIGNVRAFAAAVERLAADPVLHAQLAAAGPADVAARFSVDAMARNYQPVLDWLGSGRAHAATRFGRPFEPLRQGGQWRKYVPRNVKNLLRRYL